MNAESPSPQTIDEYIAQAPLAVQERLQQIRLAVHAAAPEAQETIKYGMPTFVLNGNLVYFAAFKRHIGFYPRVSSNPALNEQLRPYEGTKGSYHFPLNQAVPLELIAEIVKIRVAENTARVTAKPGK